jgi:hypothetical protein
VNTSVSADSVRGHVLVGDEETLRLATARVAVGVPAL